MHKVFKMGECSDYDGEEYCPDCDEIFCFKFDRRQKHLEVTCPYCGRKTMLCSMCDPYGDCDWCEEHGCKMDKKNIRKGEEKMSSEMVDFKIWGVVKDGRLNLKQFRTIVGDWDELDQFSETECEDGKTVFGYSCAGKDAIEILKKAFVEYLRIDKNAFFDMEYILEGEWFSRHMSISEDKIQYYDKRDQTVITKEEEIDTEKPHTMKELWETGYHAFNLHPITKKKAIELLNAKSMEVYSVTEHGYACMIFPNNSAAADKEDVEAIVRYDVMLCEKIDETVSNKLLNYVKKTFGNLADNLANNLVVNGNGDFEIYFEEFMQKAVPDCQKIIEDYYKEKK